MSHPTRSNLLPMPRHAVFGYGSLVNRATHAYLDAAPARLAGWRRVWRHTSLRPYAYLSVEPAEGQIDGLIALLPDADWPALDLREAAYARQVLPPDTLTHAATWPAEVSLYAVAEPGAQIRHPILQSYLDAVVQGFHREYGADGVRRFFETTAGWEVGVMDDRAAPIYSRAQRLTEEERETVDRWLQEMGGARRGL